MWWVLNGRKYSKLFFVVSALLMGGSLNIFAMNRYDRMAGLYDRYDRRGQSVLEQVQLRKELRTEINDKEAVLSDESAKKTEAEKRILQQEINDLKLTLGQLVKGASESLPDAKAVLRGMVGDDWDMVADIPVKNVPQAIQMGATIRATRALGDVVTKKVNTLVNDALGSTWDSVYKTFKKYVRDAWSLLFHHSREPFTSVELVNWAELISSCLDDFSNLVKERLGVESRARDMNSRSFDTDDQSAVNQDQAVWESIVSGYSEQIDYFIGQIDKRMHYYKDNSIETFYAQQLCNRLTAFKGIILSTRSLKDLSAKLGSNASLIKAMSNNIKKLFKKLGEEVQTSSEGNTQDPKKNSTLNDYSQRRRYGDRTDDSYPLGFDDNYYPSA